MEAQPSGVSVYTRELVRHLLKVSQGKEIHYVLFINSASFCYHRFKQDEIKKIFTEIAATNFVWRIKKIPNKFLALGESFVQKPSLKWMFGNVDVALLSNSHFFPFGDRRFPYVAIFHDLAIKRYPDCFDWRRRLRGYLIREKDIAKNAAYCISVSDHTACDLEELYGINHLKIKRIYPGVNVNFAKDFSQKKFSAITEICPELIPATAYIMAISTIEPRKNIITLIEAFAQLKKRYPTLHLVLVGSLGWKSKKLLKKIIALPNVHYLNYVSQNQKNILLRSAAALVYGSLYEGFGFPPLEAQACDVPVVTAANSSLREIVGESAILINSYDTNSLMQAIEEILNDTKLSEWYRQKGRENVKRFSWEKTAEEVLRTLLSLSR